MSTHDHHVRAGEAARPPYDVVLTPGSAGWTYCGLRVLTLGARDSVRIDTGDAEMVVLSLQGSCRVTGAAETYTVEGRAECSPG